MAGIVEEHARRAGRPAGVPGKSAMLDLSQPWDAVRRRVDTLGAAGFAYFIASWPSEGWPRIEAFASLLLPEIQAH
jgi:hypothetical protein